MAELLKNIYNDRFFYVFLAAIQKVIPDIDSNDFLSQCRDEKWEQLELKQRMRKLASTLYNNIRGKYPTRLKLMLKIVKSLPAEQSNGSLAYMLFPDFVEQYGLEHPEISLAAMEEISLVTSCEFAIRPFLIRYPELAMKQMVEWSYHADHRVRRLSTEGCRPRLPWAMAVPWLKKTPGSIIPILTQLKSDPSDFVRRSVANNLNDISRDHPELVLKICSNWQGESVDLDRLIKHACRTLLKQGDPNALKLFGTAAGVKCSIKNFMLVQNQLQIGEELCFSFQLKLNEKSPAKLRLEYAVYYAKARNKVARKIFKISELNMQPFQALIFTQKLSFRDLTTRKHYAGAHAIALIINGEEYGRKKFTLK